jgi:hypothetical protein
MNPVFSPLPNLRKINTIGQVSRKLRKFLFTSYDEDEKCFRQPEIILRVIRAQSNERELPISIVHPHFFATNVTFIHYYFPGLQNSSKVCTLHIKH